MTTWVLIAVFHHSVNSSIVILPGFISQAECAIAGRQVAGIQQAYDRLAGPAQFVCVQQTQFVAGPAEKKP